MNVLALSKDFVAPGAVVTPPPCLNVLFATSVNVPETVSVNVEASSVLPEFTVTLAAVRLVSSVIVVALSITAASVGCGKVPPQFIQLAATFQLPLPTEVQVANGAGLSVRALRLANTFR